MGHIANKIVAKDKKLADILFGQRYKIDLFQREYRWERTQIEALISDLVTSFQKSYKDGDNIEEYETYDCYYMGPLVLCEDKGALSIIDGQQRLTSFTLLLIFLHHLQIKLNISEDLSKDIMPYLYIKKGGKTSLVINVESRDSIIKELIENPNNIYSRMEERFDDLDESCRNIIERYEDITKLFPQELYQTDILPIFIEWLLDKIVLVEVRAFSMDNAYSIFETMNDRGLSLNPTEILKGYLLSKMGEGEVETKMEEANKFWKQRIQEIKNTTYNDGDLDFFRAWLRGKYADSQRSKNADSENQDFELIGTQFHSWVKNNTAKLHLKSPDNYYYFMRFDFDLFSNIYLKICNLKKGLNSRNNILYINDFYPLADSLTYPLYISPISKLDDEANIDKKINTVCKFIDAYTNIRALQGKSITQSSIRNNIYEIVKTIRNVDNQGLSICLEAELKKIFTSGNVILSQPMDSWGYYHYFYARILYYLNPHDVDDFSILMRSRRRQSLVLYRIFDETDFDSQLGIPIVESYMNSVAGFVLIKRDDIDSYEELPDAYSKLFFLKNNRYLPEQDYNCDEENAMSFIEKRALVLSQIVSQIWNTSLK